MHIESRETISSAQHHALSAEENTQTYSEIPHNIIVYDSKTRRMPWFIEGMYTHDVYFCLKI